MMTFMEYMEGKLPVVTVDFDHTLKLEIGRPNTEMVDIYKELQKDHDMYIVSSRYNTDSSREEIENFLKTNELEVKDIFLVGNDENKVAKVVELEAIAHYDDEEEKVINKLPQGVGHHIWDQDAWDEYENNDYTEE
jgi:predicted transcriptional regulator